MRTLRHAAGALVLVLAIGCGTGEELSDPDPGGFGKADGTGVVADSQFIVNGHQLNERERKWMRYVALNVIPHLAGEREDRLRVASRAGWWSLKEGDFDVSNPPRYSNCNFASGDRLIGPLETCTPNRAWQVGLAAVQVPGHTLSELETLARQLYPDKSTEEVLEDAAAEAGFPPGTSTSDAIIYSEGALRISWLLRNSPIGFTVVERAEVVPECIVGSLRWCYGTGWDTTRLYAPTKSAAMRSIEDIAALLALLLDVEGGGTVPATPWVGTPCQGDADCAFEAAGAPGFCYTFTLADGASYGFCSLRCEGYCPDRSGSATTFCIAGDSGGGMCAAKAGSLNHQCADIPGTLAYQADRYTGLSSVPAGSALVCTNHTQAPPP